MRHFHLFRVEVAPSQDEQVKALPDIELDGENLVDDDSDLEQTSQEKKEQAIEAQRFLQPVGWLVGLLCFSVVFCWWFYGCFSASPSSHTIQHLYNPVQTSTTHTFKPHSAAHVQHISYFELHQILFDKWDSNA